MRTWLPDTPSWEGTWVAGVTCDNPTDGRNYLVYLMRVGQAHESQSALWQSLPPDVRRQKSARLHRYGDLYEPCDFGGDPFDPTRYFPPHPTHVHNPKKAWRRDIDYRHRHNGRRPALLLGQPGKSFLWREPRISFSTPLQRHELFDRDKGGASEFVRKLRDR
jgi:hypothetical protein